MSFVPGLFTGGGSFPDGRGVTARTVSVLDQGKREVDRS